MASSLIENYSYAGDLICFIICLSLTVLIHAVLYFTKDYKFQLLKMSLRLIMIGTAANMLFYWVCKSDSKQTWLIYILRDVYHLSFMICLFVYMIYMKKMLDIRNQFFERSVNAASIVFAFAMILDVLSPFTKFGLNKRGGTWHDSIVSPYNIYYLYIMALLFVLLLGFSNKMIRSVRLCLMVIAAVVVIIMTISAFENTNSFTSFTYVLPIIVVVILLHSKPFDSLTGALDVGSFDDFVNSQVEKGNVLDYMVLKLNLNSNMDNDVPEELGNVLKTFWYDSFKNATFFKMKKDTFVLAIPRKEKNGNTEEKIMKMINESFPVYYEKYQFKYKILGLLNVDFIKSSSDLKKMIRYMFVTMDENTVLISDDETKEKLKNLSRVQDCLSDIERKNNLDDDRVLVYCQPIKNVKTGKYDTAEALMRLKLGDREIVSPNMFIPVAEHYGHIHALSRIMLHKVCEAIKELESAGYELDRISVNFTASELRKVNFCDEILSIIKNSGVEPQKIGIELTESQNDNDFKIMQDRVAGLRKHGMKLYLDDVGTGYSNIERIVKLNMNVVKFDRFFLLAAEQDEKNYFMMQYLAEAFKLLDYKLLFEGVENDKFERLCIECEADYLQGFKYSKPIPIERLTEFFGRKA